MQYAVIDVAIIKHYVTGHMLAICMYFICCMLHHINQWHCQYVLLCFKAKGHGLGNRHVFTLFAAHVNITSPIVLFCATLVATQLIPVYCIALSNKNYIVSYRSEKICNINHYKSAIYGHRSARSAANCNRSAINCSKSAIDHSAV